MTAHDEHGRRSWKEATADSSSGSQTWVRRSWDGDGVVHRLHVDALCHDLHLLHFGSAEEERWSWKALFKEWKSTPLPTTTLEVASATWLTYPLSIAIRTSRDHVRRPGEDDHQYPITLAVAPPFWSENNCQEASPSELLACRYTTRRLLILRCSFN